jgi:hypothetical protein
MATRIAVRKRTPPAQLSGSFVQSQELARGLDLDACLISVREEVVIIRDQWCIGRRTERRKFSIVRIGDEVEGFWMDRTGELCLRPEQIGEFLPVQAWNPAQDRSRRVGLFQMS